MCVRACVCVYVCVCVRACVCLWRRPEPWRAVEGSSLYPAYCGDALLGLAAAGGAALCALFLVFAAASAAADALVRVVVLEFVADLQVDGPAGPVAVQNWSNRKTWSSRKPIKGNLVNTETGQTGIGQIGIWSNSRSPPTRWFVSP